MYHNYIYIYNKLYDMKYVLGVRKKKQKYPKYNT
jgi:hypothetical protein